MSVGAGTIDSRSLDANTGHLLDPPGNNFSEADPYHDQLLANESGPAPLGRTRPTSYTASMTFTKTNPAGQVGSQTSVVRWLRPYALTYYGVVVSLNPSTPTTLLLTSRLWGPQGSRTITVTGSASSGHRACLASPASMGTIKRIKDSNGFPYYDINADPANNAFELLPERMMPLKDGSLELYYVAVLRSPAGTGTPFDYIIEY
jgi:hypothetical protein